MSKNSFFHSARTVVTPSGQISYVERGRGPVALFVHGVLLSGYLWRHQLDALSNVRRCLAPDLLGHGRTQIADGQDVSVTANAHMLAQFLDGLKIDNVDLVGNDSGGGICQIFAALYPERVRTLTLTNCDVHDNWPPEAFKGFVQMVKECGLGGTLTAMLSDKRIYRSQQALGPAYERPDAVSDATIEPYLRPFVSTEKRTQDLARFVISFDNKHTVTIESKLKTVRAPTLIIWGDDDVYFDVKWSQWLEKTLPNVKRRVIFKGARLFFPEERAREFNDELRAFWN